MKKKLLFVLSLLLLSPIVAIATPFQLGVQPGQDFWGNTPFGEGGSIILHNQSGLVSILPSKEGVWDQFGLKDFNWGEIKSYEDGFSIENIKGFDFGEFIINDILLSFFIKGDSGVMEVADGKGYYNFDAWGNNGITFLSNFFLDSDTIQTKVPVPVPEPATMLLFGTGLIGIAGIMRRKKE